MKRTRAATATDRQIGQDGKEIEPYGGSGKLRLISSGALIEVGPIPFGDAPAGLMQGPRYTTLGKLRTAKTLTDLF